MWTAFLIFFGFLVYIYLYSQQREIDNNLDVVIGKIIEYRQSAKSGMEIEYIYFVSNKKYKGVVKVPWDVDFAQKINFNKEYVVEYSMKDPSNSRIIIDGEKYADGVD